MEDIFEHPDNIIDKKLTAYVDSLNFAHRGQIKHMIDDIRQFFAEQFTSGDTTKAKALLDKQSN